MSFEDHSLDFKAKEGVLENKVKSKDRDPERENKASNRKVLGTRYHSKFVQF